MRREKKEGVREEIKWEREQKRKKEGNEMERKSYKDIQEKSERGILRGK